MAAPVSGPTARQVQQAFPLETHLRRTTTADVEQTDSGATCLREPRGGVRESQPPRPQTPSYDASTRELRVGTIVLKRFHQPGGSQEWILLAFEEQGWPR